MPAPTATQPHTCHYCAGSDDIEAIPDPLSQPGDPDRATVPVCAWCFPADLLAGGAY